MEASLSSHVLDTTLGKPAPNLEVRLEKKIDESHWMFLGGGITNGDGRVGKEKFPVLREEGVYRMTFHTEEYFKALGVTQYFYPKVSIDFIIKLGSHYHIPLLISPFGYSTYRGS
eukprot:TRINITY_DN4124_c0_g1_i1.p1 TRINITY_DN4124_c0_g1~~TRINITY_DN4124_c0_g1_i1.p1  ORF type:complete len:115 (-),score=28.98 TRINITY_DN4124_c0_g1_i1:107-451(-)